MFVSHGVTFHDEVFPFANQQSRENLISEHGQQGFGALFNKELMQPLENTEVKELMQV